MASFGVDLSGTDDLDANAREVSEEELLLQAIYRRITTPRGALVDDPDYGLDVRSFLHRAHTAAELGRMAQDLRAEILQDDRVDDVETKIEVLGGGTSLTIDLRLITGLGPFTLILEVTADNVAVISKGAV